MAIENWIPVIQSGLWIVAGVVLLILARHRLAAVADAIVHRIVAGAAIGLGPFKLGAMPKALPSQGSGAATSEGREGAAGSKDLEERLEAKDYPAPISEALYLLHETQVLRPRTPAASGLYRVRVWLEADSPELLARVKRVTYRLHDTFPNHVIATESVVSRFELWLQCIGEFTVLAVLETADGSQRWLTRYLDLPGRPPE